MNPNTRYSGFAIGTILLAVVLIAAIVSAIAIATRGSQTDANRETARINASIIVHATSEYLQAFSRAAAQGTNLNSLTFGTPSLYSNSVNVPGCNQWFYSNQNCANTDPNCFYGPDGFMTAPPTLPASIFCNVPPAAPNLTPQFQLRTDIDLRGVGNNLVGIVLGGIDNLTCRYLNQITMNRLMDLPPPTSLTGWHLSWLPVGEENREMRIGTNANPNFSIEPGIMDGILAGCFLLNDLELYVFYSIMTPVN
jgi:type II secretory pathway pseudopilin PulG